MASTAGRRVTLEFFVRRSQQAKMRVYVVKEGILVTPLHLIAVVKKGKISPFLAVASICTQWKLQYKWWDFALSFVTLPSILGDNVFNRWQIWLRFFEIWKIGETGVFDVLEDSLTRGRIRIEVCWVILVPRVDNFLQNHDEPCTGKILHQGSVKWSIGLLKKSESTQLVNAIKVFGFERELI